MRKTKTPSRAQVKERLLRQAAATEIPSRPDVVVVGGGAAGLVAAIVSAEEGATTVVLERDLECGRTILATGNGRCNIANTHLDPALYNARDFVRATTGDSWVEDVLAFFRQSGLAITEEDQGRLYPLSRQASSVRDVLLARAERAGVTLACSREVGSVRRKGKGFVVEGQELFGGESRFALFAPAIVLSEGHSELQVEGVGQHALFGVLCPIATHDPTLKDLDGRRAHAKITLKRAGTTIACECGEVLFRTDALSGICIFNLSRYAQTNDTLTLDLIPELTLEEAQELCRHTLAGVLDPIIASALTKREGSREAALRRAKSWELPVEGLTDTNRAQVMRGGLSLSDFSPTTLEAKAHPGLFAAGEALDVDGPCGGYNLGWAWKSAMVAGKGAAAHTSG